MGLVICPTCQEPRDPAGILCQECGTNLTGAPPADDDWSPPEAEQAQPQDAGESPAETAETAETALPACPHCGAEVPDPDNLVCVSCLRPLSKNPSAQVRLRLRLPAGERVLFPGDDLVLGRDPAVSPVAAGIADYDNVSRRHATIGLDSDGRAWVRDEGSTNGTWRNGAPVLPGARIPLADGDVLQLAADLKVPLTLERGTEREGSQQ
jgi:FHA domain/Double zinc ribbon